MICRIFQKENTFSPPSLPPFLSLSSIYPRIHQANKCHSAFYSKVTDGFKSCLLNCLGTVGFRRGFLSSSSWGARGLCPPLPFPWRRSGLDIERACRPLVVPVPQTGIAGTLNLCKELLPNHRETHKDREGR